MRILYKVISRYFFCLFVLCFELTLSSVSSSSVSFLYGSINLATQSASDFTLPKKSYASITALSFIWCALRKSTGIVKSSYKSARADSVGLVLSTMITLTAKLSAVPALDQVRTGTALSASGLLFAVWQIRFLCTV